MVVFYNLPNQIVGDKVEVDDEVVAMKQEEITAARLTPGRRPFLTDVLTEAYLDKLRDMDADGEVRVRAEYPQREHHYAINIKVHSLDLTDEQEWFIYDDLEEMLDLFWRDHILPWIWSRGEDEPDILQAGRSGGWLVLDRPVVGDPEKDKHATHWPEFHEARSAYRDVKSFLEGWNDVFEGIRERLAKMLEERGDSGR
ncbi:hypothetical protein AKJ41_01135 [candidate division MSBL1 archaeon SCGC-AAA259O05]|uniref:Uncharacterized protein n=1 Tax=candidate division MSBL1 archaeon SCGC-AAA259O05 TaxID=1698271 RepID=A0A133V558_9EURY|nr:hypothetical protein AKJ41_01135 [candidate division MSBL1 archaeon SCGC-AAA259O05]